MFDLQFWAISYCTIILPIRDFANSEKTRIAGTYQIAHAEIAPEKKAD